MQVPLLLPQLSRQAVGDLDPVSGHDTARDGLAPAGIAPPMVPAVPTALEAHERVGGPAATRQSVLVRAVIALYTQPTQIEIPIPSMRPPVNAIIPVVEARCRRVTSGNAQLVS